MTNMLLELSIARGRDFGEFGIGLVPMSSYEPDSQTSRHKYYYNTRENVLYMIVATTGVPFWKRVSSFVPSPPPHRIVI
jgi:hypothetical protein